MRKGVFENDNSVNSVDHSIHAVALEVTAFLERVYSGEKLQYSFGWGATVDAATYGLEPEQMIILAGDAKNGKTLSAVNTAYVNSKEGKRVLIVTTEMSRGSYLLRLVSRELGIPLARIRAGETDPQERVDIAQCIASIAGRPLFIVEHPLCTTEELTEAVAETMPELVIVDHLQRMQYSGDNPALGYKKIALAIKNLAVAWRIPFLVLSQVTFGEGWRTQDAAGKIMYDTSRMTTQWSRAPIAEADKVLVLDNVGMTRPDRRGDMNLVIHSMRDYPSGDVLPLKVVESAQFLGDFQEYSKLYAEKRHGTKPF